VFILYSNNTLVSDRAEQETQEKTIMVVSMQSTRIMIMSIEVLAIYKCVLQCNLEPILYMKIDFRTFVLLLALYWYVCI
jgi:uncharacterized membrane protein AbrB (regulator of aidB expression)